MAGDPTTKPTQVANSFTNKDTSTADTLAALMPIFGRTLSSEAVNPCQLLALIRSVDLATAYESHKDKGASSTTTAICGESAVLSDFHQHWCH